MQPNQSTIWSQQWQGKSSQRTCQPASKQEIKWKNTNPLACFQFLLPKMAGESAASRACVCKEEWEQTSWRKTTKWTKRQRKCHIWKGGSSCCFSNKLVVVVLHFGRENGVAKPCNLVVGICFQKACWFFFGLCPPRWQKSFWKNRREEKHLLRTHQMVRLQRDTTVLNASAKNTSNAF